MNCQYALWPGRSRGKEAGDLKCPLLEHDFWYYFRHKDTKTLRFQNDSLFLMNSKSNICKFYGD